MIRRNFIHSTIPLVLLLMLFRGAQVSFAHSQRHEDAMTQISARLLSSAASTERVSVASGGTEGNDHSYSYSFGPTISADGRYVVFYSLASNLVSGDTNNAIDVFLRDRQTGQTACVSIASDGAQGNGDSSNPVISADGRYVAFHSSATNLVPGDTNDEDDVFVYDQQTGQVERVSIASNGTQGDDDSRFPDISPDGRFVAFESLAGTLVSGDTNYRPDIFVHDRQTHQTTRVSVKSNGAQMTDAFICSSVSISADGRYVAFHSDSGELVAGDTNTRNDVFLHDRQTGETTRISVTASGQQVDGESRQPSISSDGRYIAFHSDADGLVGEDANLAFDIFVHDRQTGQIQRVSVASDSVPGNSYSYDPSISDDGRYVAFQSQATNLVPGDTNGVYDIFVHDRQTGQTTRVSISTSGVQGNGASVGASISPDGRFVIFESSADNLLSTGDTNAKRDIFFHVRGEPPSTSDVDAWVDALALVGAPPDGVAAISIEYGNDGATPATSVVITATLDASLSYLSDSSGISPTINGSVLAWHLPDLSYPAEGQFFLLVGLPNAPYGTRYPLALAIDSAGPEADQSDNAVALEVMVAHRLFLPLVIK